MGWVESCGRTELVSKVAQTKMETKAKFKINGDMDWEGLGSLSTHSLLGERQAVLFAGW